MQAVEAANDLPVYDEDKRSIVNISCKESVCVMRVCSKHLLVKQRKNLLLNRAIRLRLRKGYREGKKEKWVDATTLHHVHLKYEFASQSLS